MAAVGKRWRRAAGCAMGALFVAVIGMPSVCRLMHWEPLPAVTEYRYRTSRPRMPHDRESFEAYPARFEAYFNDHFGLRPALLRGMHCIKGKWLGVSTAANVVLGTEGWLYYTEKPVGTDYQSVRPFRTAEMRIWCRVLQKRHDWLKRRGIPYVVFIPPDKQTVYPEHLPPHQRPPQACRRLDQLREFLAEHSDVPVLDVRDRLLAAKGHERVYHVTDSHWNDRGAFIGYQALMGVLAAYFPALRPLPRSAFVEVCQKQEGGDLAKMIAREHTLQEENLLLVPLSSRRAHRLEGFLPSPSDSPVIVAPHATECDDPVLPRAVFFNDSFCWALEPFLKEHFRRAVFTWTDQFSPELVRREQPDVVIQELVERKLGIVTPMDFDDAAD